MAGSTKPSLFQTLSSMALADFIQIIQAAGPTDSKITLANFLQAIGGNIYNPHKFRVFRTSALNTGNGADALVTFDTNSPSPTSGFDTSGEYNVSTGKFQPTAPGYYWLFSKIGCAAVSYGILSIYKNGSVYSTGPETTSSAGSMGFSVADEVYLNGTTDYVQIYSNTTTAQAIITGASASYFGGFMLST